MAKVKEQREQMRKDIEAAAAGDLPWLDEMIRASGYIHPDKGVRQRDLSDAVNRKVLRQWEDDGLESVKIKNAKHYPVVRLIKFVLDRSLKWRSTKSENITEWAEKEAEYKAKERELKYKERAGNFLPADEVKKVWCAEINSVRKRLLAIPRAMATRLLGVKKRHDIEKVVREEINSALEELSR